MKGNPDVLSVLSDVLVAELTAINQYFIHSKMCDNWGYKKLAKRAWDESISEMKHADRVIARILLLDGQPNMQKYGKINVGPTFREQLSFDLDLERAAVSQLNAGIKICAERGDNVTRSLLESILMDEEGSIDWLEAQMHLVGEVGYERYLAEQMG